MARLILDTGVIVAAVRDDRPRILEAITDQDDVAVPAVAVAEYLTGVELDDDPARRAAQAAFLDELLGAVPIIDYTTEVARHHAALLAHVHRTGRPRGAHDLIIAASARATGRILLTTDAKADFGELPEVEHRLLTH
ncbi:MAG: PIN domain-containing protein [Kineosporiaceae bacterium]|nr:PIN domain-containing protein [Kineosporiaceae bacterium]